MLVGRRSTLYSDNTFKDMAAIRTKNRYNLTIGMPSRPAEMATTKQFEIPSRKEGSISENVYADSNATEGIENSTPGKTDMVTLKRSEAITFVTGASESKVSTVDQSGTTYPKNYTGTNIL